jgi:uncharacterized SAM-binding protein YcdF (DUF218 family)
VNRYRVLIVSDPLHMRRAMTMARDFGLNAYPSPTPTSRYISLSSRLDFLWGEVRYYAAYLVRRLTEESLLIRRFDLSL